MRRAAAATRWGRRVRAAAVLLMALAVLATVGNTLLYLATAAPAAQPPAVLPPQPRSAAAAAATSRRIAVVVGAAGADTDAQPLLAAVVALGLPVVLADDDAVRARALAAAWPGRVQTVEVARSAPPAAALSAGVLAAHDADYVLLLVPSVRLPAQTSPAAVHDTLRALAALGADVVVPLLVSPDRDPNEGDGDAAGSVVVAAGWDLALTRDPVAGSAGNVVDAVPRREGLPVGVRVGVCSSRAWLHPSPVPHCVCGVQAAQERAVVAGGWGGALLVHRAAFLRAGGLDAAAPSLTWAGIALALALDPPSAVLVRRRARVPLWPRLLRHMGNAYSMCLIWSWRWPRPLVLATRRSVRGGGRRVPATRRWIDGGAGGRTHRRGQRMVAAAAGASACGPRSPADPPAPHQ
jgi:hypothetical protein